MTPGNTSLDDMAAVLDSLTPEERAQLLGLGTNDERSQLVQQQLAQVQSQQMQPQQYSTPIGNALGGAAGLLSTINTQQQQAKANAELEALLGQKDAGRALYGSVAQRQVGSARAKALREQARLAREAVLAPGVIAPYPGGR